MVCKVTVGGASGQKVVPEITPGGSASCSVTLTSSPTAGSATLTATIEKVPGETDTTNNTQSFPVTITG